MATKKGRSSKKIDLRNFVDDEAGVVRTPKKVTQKQIKAKKIKQKINNKGILFLLRLFNFR